MVALQQRLKNRVVLARKNHDEVEKGILQVVLGDVETLASRDGKDLTEKQIANIIRKLIESNHTTLNHLGQMESEGGGLSDTAEKSREKLLREITILQEFLPKTLTVADIKDFFKKVDPGFSRLLDVKSDGQAIGLALRALETAGQHVNAADVKSFVTEIRNAV